MRMNRRNVLVGLGTTIIGGGAALGSGAFSQAQAERTLEINVVTGENIADELVDIVLKPGNHSSVGLSSGTPTNLFPNASDGSDYNAYTHDQSDVSLIENDVTIVIGTTGNKLPPNSTISYEPLFAVVNDDPSGTGANFDVKFGVSDTDSTFTFTGASSGNDYTNFQEISAASNQEINTDVTTGSSSASSGKLTISITESTS